jgi:uncharacterized protein YndB with AHSA1/START domain
MNPDTLEIKAKLQIQKPVEEVFEAIVDPAKMSNYFISKSSGRIEEGKTVDWSFPEFEMSFPVRIEKVEKNKYISYYWEAPDRSKELLVEIKLEPRENNSTLVSVTEKNMENNEAGIKWVKQNTEGWANFLACMKAYLEYGINF